MNKNYIESGIEVISPEKILLMRCPKCKRENYAINVVSGICTWCGYNAHDDSELLERAKKWKDENKTDS